VKFILKQLRLFFPHLFPLHVIAPALETTKESIEKLFNELSKTGDNDDAKLTPLEPRVVILEQTVAKMLDTPFGTQFAASLK
jgi:L-lactate utilization protein LutB